MPRRKKKPAPEAERGSVERLPDRLEGRFRCPGCTRVFDILSKDDLQTAKIHLRNRLHGAVEELERVEPDKSGESSQKPRQRASA